MYGSLNTVANMTGNAINPSELDNLIVELTHYRRQSEWLARINELHSRLAGAVDLPGMIEAFSVWLMPFVGHDLIAYKNIDRHRLHMFCSCHGPARRSIMQAAETLFGQEVSPTGGVVDGSELYVDDYFAREWRFESRKSRGHLLLLGKDQPFTNQDWETVIKGLEILTEPLQRAVDYEDLFEQARRDTLTGLPNRRVFEERVGPLLDNAHRYEHPITVACMDLDNFKQVNDTFGHAAGDLVLQQVAQIMRQMVRNTDLLVRMGGDEFMLVLPDTELQAARIMADRLCQAVDLLDIRTPGANRLGISIGLSQWHSGLSRDAWLQQADEALYQAKSSGRSRVCMPPV